MSPCESVFSSLDPSAISRGQCWARMMHCGPSVTNGLDSPSKCLRLERVSYLLRDLVSCPLLSPLPCFLQLHAGGWICGALHLAGLCLNASPSVELDCCV